MRWVGVRGRAADADTLGCSDLPRSRCRRRSTPQCRGGRRVGTPAEAEPAAVRPRVGAGLDRMVRDHPPDRHRRRRRRRGWRGVAAGSHATPSRRSDIAGHVGCRRPCRRSPFRPPPWRVGTSTFVVHVAGAVAAPGVYDVRAPARVVDAIDAAGGPSPQAELDSLNLAAPLVDGQRIYVPVVGEIVPPVADGSAVADEAVSGPIDLQHRDRRPSSRNCPASGRRPPRRSSSTATSTVRSPRSTNSPT